MSSSPGPRSPPTQPPDLAQYSFLSAHEDDDASSSGDEASVKDLDRIQDEDGVIDGEAMPHHHRHATTTESSAALWEEDSPYFAERAHDSLHETKELCSSSIKELVKGMKELCKATTAMGVASHSLARANKKAAEKLADAASLSNNNSGGISNINIEIVPVLHRFSNVLEEMASAHETLVHSMTQSFVVPLESFCAHDIDKAVDQEKVYHQQKNAFTDTLGKLLRGQLKPNAKVSPAMALSTRASDVGQARRGMELARHRLAHSVHTLETRRTLEVTEGVAAVLYAYQAHHHMLMDTLSSLGPSLETLQASQMKAHEGLNDAQGRWERRAEMLEMLLPTEVAERRLEAGDEARFAQLSTMEATSTTILSTPLLDLVDRKFAVLDVQNSLRTFFQPRAAPGVHYESYLHMRVPTKGLASTTATHTWIRRWFVLEGSSLYFVRESSHDPQGSDGMEGSERSLVCDVVLSSVREVPSTGTITSGSAATTTSSSSNDPHAVPLLPYCLEIFSANRKAVVLQAEGPADYQGWIQALRRRIERLLVSGEGMALSSGPSSPERARSKSPVPMMRGSLSPRKVLGSSSLNSRATSPVPAVDAASVAQDREHYPPKILDDPLLHQLTEQNPTCADCEALYPDWVSLNLGVLVCLQCSGVHRSLGVHVSKVRSLALDDVDEADLRLLGKLGNARVNAIYEHKLLDGWYKPKPDAPRATREQFIKAKYVWRGFTAMPSSEGPEKHSQALMEAVLANDLSAALEALAKGGDVNWVGDKDKRRTALHAAAARGDSVVEAVAFLVQNGGNVGVRDRDDLTPLDLATQGHHGETVRYLLKF